MVYLEVVSGIHMYQRMLELMYHYVSLWLGVLLKNGLET